MTDNDSDAAPEIARNEAASGDSNTNGTGVGTRRSSADTTATLATEAR